MIPKKQVAIGLLGTTLDAGKGAPRWERWRPTIALCQHENLLVSRLELLYQKQFEEVADQIVSDIADISPETAVKKNEVEFDDPWDLEEVYEALSDFARGYPFSPDEEDYLVHITTGTHVAQICLFLLTESRELPGRLIQTSPPKRGEAGPGSFTVIDLDLSRYDRIASRFKREKEAGLSFLKSGIDTKNAAFNRLIEQIERVAIASRAPILLMGPTGAGKSQLAKKLYELKKTRRQVAGEFVEVNCATLRGDGAMSTLFGHARGAFTGAVQDRPGLLRKAHNGILFLDEIGELGVDEQAVLLRAVEEKVFFPLGSDREVFSEFQLIAGTNRDLMAQVAKGAFREDLLARINLWTFKLPGLADRPEDIPPNLEYELEGLARKMGTRITFSREAKERFLRFATGQEARWPGNFRDFNASITRMATLAPGGRISVEVVDEEVGRLRQSSRPAAELAKAGLVDELLGEGAASLDRFDRVQLEDVLKVCRAARSLSEAGRALYASSREQKKTQNDADRLRKYLGRFGLSWERLRPAAM
jgi:transcriptional regulatory protein RtcR